MTQEEGKKDLEKLTRTKLIEEAKNYPDIVGAHGMSKEELIEAIRAEKAKLGEEVPEKKEKAPKAGKPKKTTKVPDRAALKAAMKEIRGHRQEAVAAKDGVQLKRLRRRYKKLNRTLRQLAAVK